MDAPAARCLKGIDLRGEVLAFGSGHPGVADRDRFRCVTRLLFRFVWQPVFARRNAMFRLRLRTCRTNERLRNSLNGLHYSLRVRFREDSAMTPVAPLAFTHFAL